MPCQLCLEYPGAVSHVVDRGDRGEEIFRDDPGRERFLSNPHRGLWQDRMAGPGIGLGGRSKSCAVRQKGMKVRMAVRLRRETTMSLKWIAERLAMGSWTNVSNLLGVERAKTAINFTK